MLVMTYLGYAHHSPTPEYVGGEGRRKGRGEEREDRWNVDVLNNLLEYCFIRLGLIYSHQPLPPSLPPSLPLRGNIRMAFLAIAFVFLTHCFLHCRDSVLIRPHPGVWRVVHGIGMLYLMCLGVLLGR